MDHINFIFDLDGTILNSQTDCVDNKIIDALISLSVKNNIYFATGRDKIGLMNFFKKNPNWNSYFKSDFVYLDGAVSVKDNTFLYSLEYVDFFSEIYFYDFILFYSDKIVFSNKNAFKKYQFLFPNVKMEQFKNYYDISSYQFDLESIYRIYLFPKRKNEFLKLIKVVSKWEGFQVAFSKQFNMCIIKGHHDKYISIKNITDSKEYVFFGDGINDELMFSNAIYSINLGNVSYLKRIADKNINSKEQLIEEIVRWIK